MVGVEECSMSQPGLWDWEERQEKLNQKKDLLVRLNEIIP